MVLWRHCLFQNSNKKFSGISALASKKKSNQKSSVRESKYNPPITLDSGINIGLHLLISEKKLRKKKFSSKFFKN